MKMSSTDKLFRLIKSMKRGEKRAFKMFASQYNKSSKNIYVRLFDVIDGLSTYDEEAIKQKFSKEKFIKQLAVTKNYLFNIILKSLRTFHTEHDIDFKINEGVESAKILFQRGLYKQAAKTIIKIKSYAWECERFELLLNLIHIERRIMKRYLIVGELNEFMHNSKAESSTILAVINNREEYQALYDAMFFIYRTYGQPRSEMEKERYGKIVNHPLLGYIEQAQSTLAKSYYNVIYTVYYDALNDQEKAFGFVKDEIEMLERNPNLTVSHMSRYLSALNNALHIYTEQKDSEHFTTTAEKIRSLPSRFPHMGVQAERRIFEITYSLELTLCLKTKNFARGLELVPEVAEGLKQFGILGGALDLDISMMYDVVRLHFFSGDFDSALNWTDKIFDYEKSNIAINIICYAKVLNLIIHYEKKHDALLEYKLKSVRRYLSKNNRLFDVEDSILKLLYKLIQHNNDKVRLEELRKYRDKFDSLPNNSYKQLAQSHMNIQQWLDSKLLEKPMKSVLKESDIVTI